MCELIPSPPMARYASSLGLDRSARRYHSVLSRPLSPEPRPQRKKSRRHMLSSPKEKGPEKTKVLRNFSGRCKVQNLRTDPCLIKNERDNEERLTSINHPVDAGVTMTNGTVEMLLNNMKTEPGSNELPLLNDHSEVISINSCDMNEVKSVLPINQSNCVYSVPQFSKDIVERLAGERITFFKERGQGAEFSDKENSSVGIRPMKSGDPESVIDEIDMNKEIERTISMNETRVSQKKSKDASACNSSKEIKYKFSCDICSYKSMRENHFVKHMKLHDKGLALYRCNECSFVSIRASHLRRHQMSHAIQVLRCHICAYTCDDKKLLTKHVRVKHQTPKQQKSVNSVPEIQKIFECDDCEYKTTWQYSFQRHRRTHTSSKMVVNHSCPQCSYKTMRREHFLRHIKNVHQNHRPFLCDICGKAFKRQDALKQHHVTHYQNISSSSSSSGQMGPYGIICHICQKVCRSSAYLKEHMATHSEERSFLCEVCGASFKTRSVQRNHVQTIHRRPRAFTCSACEKKFNTKFALRRHMKQHDLSLDDPEGMPMIAGPYSICSLQPMESVNQADSDCLPSSSINRPIGPAPPTISSSQAPTSAYHITIDGQPAFILPSIDDPHALVEGDSGTVLVDGSTATSSELPSLGGHSGRDNPLSVPVTPNAVHVVEQDPLAVDSSSIMMSPEQYETSRVVGTTPNETANYVASEHTNSTLLYLTANFE